MTYLSFLASFNVLTKSGKEGETEGVTKSRESLGNRRGDKVEETGILIKG